MKKQVLILTTTHDFLGKFEMENVKLLQRMGYVVHYAARMEEPHYISDRERLERMGVQIHSIEIARSPYVLRDNQKALKQILKLIELYHFDILHCHTPVGGVLGRLAGKLSGDKNLTVIYTAHGFHFYKQAPLWNRLVYYGIEKRLARFTDILIVINEEDYRHAKRFHLKKGGKVYKIPGIGLDRNRFRPLSQNARKAFRKKLGIQEEDFFLVSVGELNENKNHRILLKAFQIVKENYPDAGNFRLGICGDGFLRRELERQIQELGLDEMVSIYGYCPKVWEILGCADASLFPSKREGLGMAALESLAMGIPVIASDNRGTREYMEHKKNGFVCHYEDAGGFAKGILTLKEMSKRKREQMSRYCIASAEPFDKKYANAVMKRIYLEVNQKVERNFYEKPCENQYYYERV